MPYELATIDDSPCPSNLVRDTLGLEAALRLLFTIHQPLLRAMCPWVDVWHPWGRAYSH